MLSYENTISKVNGKTLLYIAGNKTFANAPEFLPSILKTVRQHGLYIVACFDKTKTDTGNCGYYQQFVDDELFDEDIHVDMSQDMPERIAEAARSTGHSFDGVWGVKELIMPVVGQVQTLLNIEHANGGAPYKIARDKFQTRVALERANLNTPKAHAIKSIDDIDAAIERVGFPMIIKPTAGAGSEGVYKAFNRDDLVKFTAQILKEIESNPYLTTDGLDLVAPIVAETLLIPVIYNDVVQEFDVDILVSHGKMVYGNVIDNWIPDAPYFQDKVVSVPSVTPNNVQKELLEYSFECVKALGFKSGAFHVESMYTENGPMLLEVNPRVGGGEIQQCHERVYGVDLNLNALLSFLNIDIAPPSHEQPQMARFHQLICTPKTGTVKNLDYMEHAKNYQFTKKVQYAKKSGDKVVGLDTGVPNWVGFVVMECGVDQINAGFEDVKACEADLTEVLNEKIEA